LVALSYNLCYTIRNPKVALFKTELLLENTMTKNIDQIQRVIDLPVDITRAWRAISTPEDISNWFSDHASFTAEVGAEIVFDWDDYGKKYGRVEVIKPPYQFGFRWLAGDAGLKIPIKDDNSTLVMMELTEIPDGTRLTVTESGFSKLAADLQKSEFLKNEAGWDYELNDLKKYIEGEVK
jgi:uncharacterized protein YndB with AHSA1/START domain